MTTVASVTSFLERYAPLELAEEWDNVGLLVGDPTASVERVMTCLTVTPASAAEAVEEQADLIVAHHPLPFRPLNRLTPDVVAGRLLLQLMRAGVAIYSPHTAFDSAEQGINQRLAEGLELTNIAPLVPHAAGGGAGRCGELASEMSLGNLADRVKLLLHVEGLHRVGDATRPVRRVAVACGSAGEFLPTALEMGCDCFLTGEARFHTCLEAEAEQIGLLLAGHYATERFGIEALAADLARQFPDLHVWPSSREADPSTWC